MCLARGGGPRTPSRTTIADLDCASVKNVLLFVAPKKGGRVLLGSPFKTPWFGLLVVTIPAERFEAAAAECGLARLCLAMDRSDNEPRCIESSISAETLRPEAPLKQLLYPELVVAVDDIDMLFEAAVAAI